MTDKELEKIKTYVKLRMEKGNDPLHAYDHAEKVAGNALQITKILDIKDIDKNLLLACCYLHDLPVAMSRHLLIIKHWLEPHSIKKYLPKVLNELELSESDKKMIYKTILRHPFSIPYRRLNRKGDMYIKVMQDADSIDYFQKDRERDLRKNKLKDISYLVLSFISGGFLSYGRKNLGSYLNYPELAKYDWFKQ